MKKVSDVALSHYPSEKDMPSQHTGQGPENWHLRRLKDWVDINEDILPENTDPDLEFRYMEISALNAGVLVEAPQKTRFSNAPSRARRRVKAGDTIISTVRTYLKAIWHADNPGTDLVCSTGFAVLTPKRGTNPKFVSYLVQSEPFTDRVTAESVGTAYPAISENKLASFKVLIPPLDEQAAIVRYLDAADQRIREYVSAKERLIALLEEERQTVIHQAVTRGLDPNVTLKPSGVEWLGDVPEHWEIQQLKQKSRIFRGRFSHRPRNDPSLYDGPYPFIQTGDIARAGKWITTYEQTLNVRGLAVSQMFPRGTLVMTIAANIGDAAILDLDACFPDSVVGFTPSHNVDRDYLYNLFQSMKTEFLRVAPVNTQGNLNVDRIGATIVAFPPLAEQTAIAAHLNQLAYGSDIAIDRARRRIELMEEYRTRLIADVVTGKIDVRSHYDSAIAQECGTEWKT